MKNPKSVESINKAKTLLKEIEVLREEQRVDAALDKMEVSEAKEIKVSYKISDDYFKYEAERPVKAKSHSFYIVQERDGTPINWKKPLIDTCSMTTSIKVA